MLNKPSKTECINVSTNVNYEKIIQTLLGIGIEKRGMELHLENMSVCSKNKEIYAQFV
jgi:hypothetical protein